MKAPLIDAEDGCTNMNSTRIELAGLGGEANFQLYRNRVAVAEADTESDDDGDAAIEIADGHGIDFTGGETLTIRKVGSTTVLLSFKVPSTWNQPKSWECVSTG